MKKKKSYKTLYLFAKSSTLCFCITVYPDLFDVLCVSHDQYSGNELSEDLRWEDKLCGGEKLSDPSESGVYQMPEEQRVLYGGYLYHHDFYPNAPGCVAK